MDSERSTVGACPKNMVFGPCADGGDDGSCEVPPSEGGPPRCPFAAQWAEGVFLRVADASGSAGVSPKRDNPSARLGDHRTSTVMTELPDVGRNGQAVRSMARQLAGCVDAVLFGDVNWDRVQFPPSYRAALIEQEGLRAWPGVNARDRNRVALEGELLALHDLNVAGVHCVTGNHPYSGNRPDAAPVFDLDSTRLVKLAADIGLTTSVAASPHSFPSDLRPVRTFDKGVAGASICFIDQPVNAAGIVRFIDRVRACGPTSLTFQPVITIVTSLDDFDRWRQYPNARVPEGWSDALTHASTRVADTGLSLAVDLARSLLDIDGVSGVLFASTSTPSNAREVAAVFRDAASALRG